MLTIILMFVGLPAIVADAHAYAHAGGPEADAGTRTVIPVTIAAAPANSAMVSFRMSSSTFWLKPCRSFSFGANSGRGSHSDKERRPTGAAFLPGTFRSAPGFHGVAGPELTRKISKMGAFAWNIA